MSSPSPAAALIANDFSFPCDRSASPPDQALPLEIITLIIVYLKPEEDAGTLANVAQCSHALHAIAIPILYSHIHLYRGHQCYKLFQHLSIKSDKDKVPIIPSYAVKVPVVIFTQIGTATDRSEFPHAFATRKLKQLLHTLSFSLHCFPTLKGKLVRRPGAQSKYRPKAAISGKLWKVFDTVPNTRGLALGSGFFDQLLGLLRPLEALNPHRCPDDCAFNQDWEVEEEPRLRSPFGTLSNRYELEESCLAICDMLASRRRCFSLDDIPDNLCRHLCDALVYFATSRDVWVWGSILISHSTFPRKSLKEFTRVRGHWRHFIHVDQSEFFKRSTEDAATQNTVSAEIATDNFEKRLLRAIAEDIYTIALPTLEEYEKPRRRDMIMSGISNDQTRQLEQVFVELVRERFFDSEAVIVEPDGRFERSRKAAMQGEASIEPHAEDWCNDSRNNRCADGGSDFEDEDAVRDYQKRVVMFDFFHESKAAACEGCGAGAGHRRRNLWGGHPEHPEPAFWV